MKQTNKHLFCFGAGYVASSLSQDLRNEGWDVSASCQTLEKKKQLETKGISAFLIDQSQQKQTWNIPQNITHILLSAPPEEDGDPIYKRFIKDLQSLKELKWVGYLSSTAVYGDKNGEWVNEKSLPVPTSDRGIKRLNAENVWLDSELPVHIFRLSGIYGPGRNALERLMAGQVRNIIKKDHVFCRIHRDDIIQVLRQSMEKPQQGAIYNLADDFPSSAQEVLEYAANLTGLPIPSPTPLEESNASPMLKSFYKDQRKVSNSKIKQELGIRLKYPSYRQGLTEIMYSLHKRSSE